MMKIAVACDGENVAEHFGHCEGFAIFDAENGRLLGGEQRIPNPGHRPGFLPNFLHEQGVTVVVSGGMGGGAIQIFNEKNIAVITGAVGSAADAAKACAEGRLLTTGAVCNRHEHHGECGGH